MMEVDGLLFTGHSKGLIMVWDYVLGERVIKTECLVKDPVTSMVYLKNQLLLWVSMMNGDMLLLRVNTEVFSLDTIN